MFSFQGFFERMGSNFMVAAFVPSLAFITICVIVFEPMLPDPLKLQLMENERIIQDAFILLLLSAILGFTLTSLNVFVTKVYEGHILIWRFRYFKMNEQRRERRFRKWRKLIKRKMKRLDSLDSRKAKKNLRTLRSLDESLKTRYHFDFPLNEGHILSTPMGNRLRAAEEYANDRYGIDSVVMWPRLIEVMPDDYYKKVNQGNAD